MTQKSEDEMKQLYREAERIKDAEEKNISYLR